MPRHFSAILFSRAYEYSLPHRAIPCRTAKDFSLRRMASYQSGGQQCNRAERSVHGEQFVLHKSPESIRFFSGNGIDLGEWVVTEENQGPERFDLYPRRQPFLFYFFFFRFFVHFLFIYFSVSLADRFGHKKIGARAVHSRFGILLGAAREKTVQERGEARRGRAGTVSPETAGQRDERYSVAGATEPKEHSADAYVACCFDERVRYLFFPPSPRLSLRVHSHTEEPPSSPRPRQIESLFRSPPSGYSSGANFPLRHSMFLSTACSRSRLSSMFPLHLAFPVDKTQGETSVRHLHAVSNRPSEWFFLTSSSHMWGV